MKFIGILFFSTLGLYGQWITGFYTAENGKEPPANIPWSKFTHIIHNEAWPNSNGTLSDYIAPSETQQIVAAKPAGKSFLVQIADNGSDLNAFGSATSSATMTTFVNNIVSYVNSNGYDGVDIDWEANTNTAQFSSLLSKLRSAMPGKVIAIDVYGPVVPVAAASYPVLDQINVMCYDMDLWSGYSWYNDALINGGSNNSTCSTRVGQVLSAGVPASKIGIGIPYYGRRWTGCTQAFQSSCPAGNAKTFFFRDLAMDSTRWQPQYQFYDPQYNSDYLSIPGLNEFDSYNGPRFMKDAAVWAKANGLGGFMVFTQEYEYLPNQTGDAQYPLSSALYNAVFGGAPTITTTSLPPGAVGTAYSQVLIGTGSPTWSVVSGTLPAGLSLNSSTGVISGTPTTAGTGNFTVKAANSAGTALQALSIVINAPAAAPAITTKSLSAGMVGAAYSQTLTATGTAPITWSVVSGALPAGLSLDSSVGSITGTPTAAGTSAFTVRASNSMGSANASLSLVVNTPPAGPSGSGLYAYWKLDDGSGSTAADSSGNGKTATLSNAPGWLTAGSCPAGSCASFNGSNQYGSATLDLSGTSAVTVSFWMNWTSYANDDRLAMEVSPDFNNSTTGFMIDPNSSFGGGGQFEVGLRGDAGYNQVLFARPNLGWHHYAFIFNKAAGTATEVIPYVDGAAVPYTKTTSADNTNNFGLDTLYFMSRSGSALFGNGTLDEVQVYTQALSASQVQSLAAAYTAPVAIQDTQPPTVSITAPTAGQTITSGTIANLRVNATDNVAVTGVQYFLDGVKLGTPVTIAPFSLKWTASRGRHTLTAQAWDAAGNITTSAPVSFRVR